MFPTPDWMTNAYCSRRGFLRGGIMGSMLFSGSSWLPCLAAESTGNPNRKRACILLWMSGGPSQMDTFDLKPGHENGGPFKEIETSASGIRISEHLPKIAQLMQHVSLIRSMSTKEGDHTRAMQFLHTGYAPAGPVLYPTLGSLVCKELSSPQADLPGYVSVAPSRAISPLAHSPGFLGASYAPMIVGSGSGNVRENADWAMLDRSLRVENLVPPPNVPADETDRRLALLQMQEEQFRKQRPDVPVLSHQSAYEKAARLMRSSAAEAFQLNKEPEALRARYGKSQFGQGCLLARRLIERGVPFVEVSLNGAGGILSWDSHQQNFATVKTLSEILDAGWSTLLEDLQQRGLLENTLVVWMGEFGRTPKINNNTGRDHFPDAWTTALCGGGIRGGQVIGKTSPDGMKVAERSVGTSDFLATVCRAVGIDPDKENISNVGRPIPIVDRGAKPVVELF
ncbi:MAG: DUF1501 domain-containing protein [Planctomycetales bacterium]